LVHAPADDNRSGASFPQTAQSVEIILRNTGFYSNETAEDAHIDPILTKKVV
jgi:glyceraldehyde-3-phosphate dehydrogenase/erythrose-4-phosphate dehydrogenase